MTDAVNRYLDRLLAIARAVRGADRARLAAEARELGGYLKKQSLTQIPSISTIAGLGVGSWVASTFTTSRFKGFLASHGLIRGGTHVVGPTTYKILSVVLPVVAMAVTAYVVQKGLKARREQQLARDVSTVARLAPATQAEVQDKMRTLEEARVAGLVSESEYQTKRAVLYESYARAPRSKLEDIILNKMT
jgi:hypothetical protein